MATSLRCGSARSDRVLTGTPGARIGPAFRRNTFTGRSDRSGPALPPVSTGTAVSARIAFVTGLSELVTGTVDNWSTATAVPKVPDLRAVRRYAMPGTS